MIRFRDLSISRKLVAASVLSTGLALVAAAVVSFAFQVRLIKQTAIRDVTVAGKIVAANAAGALAFNDSEGAKTILSALRAHSEVTEARLLDANGHELARFKSGQRGGLPLPEAVGSSLVVSGTRILVSEKVIFGRDELGRLDLAADIRETLLSMTMIGGTVLLVVISGALLFAYFLVRRIQRGITAPLFSLATTARTVAAENDYTVRASKFGEDEIGHLTDAFNHMLAEVHQRDLALRHVQAQLSEQVATLKQEMAERRRAEAELARTHKDLVDASRRAGQAEVASNVLHNVGNVLNSVIVSSNLVIERLRSSKAPNVTLAATLLQDNRDRLGSFFVEEPKGKMLLSYLPHLGQELESDRALILAETQSLARNIEHIKEIISTQQAYSRAAGMDEEIRISEVTDHALALAQEALGDARIEVVRNYANVPPLVIDKHRVLQILVNLIRNAIQALNASDTRCPELKIEVESDHKHVRIRVVDNGVGIAPENLTKIFHHGFTTRRDGHGFGLHSGALAARQMGGSLRAQSAGPGLGAVFTLELPLPSGSHERTQ